MSDSELETTSFQTAKIRAEWARVAALLGVFAGLLALVLIRGFLSLAAGHRGEAWPFILLLAAMTSYELARLRIIRQAIALGRRVSRARWIFNIFIESLLPTIALFLQIHTQSFGPARTLTSPVVLGCLLLILLSTLHLDPVLSRLAGIFSAGGYAAAAIWIFVEFPETAAGAPLVVYGSSMSYVGFLLVGGFAAGAVSRQIRLYVVAALRDAEHRAKIAQFEHDLGMARSIQQGLLPISPPCISGFDVAGWNEPADETGGDYFDWQQLPDGRVAVTVADVTGHGIGSALLMSACRAYARSGFAADADLQKLLGRLNRLLHQDLPPEKFVTLVAGVLDPNYSTGQLISAGHGPLLFYSSAEDTFLCIDAQGPPLALLPGITYKPAETLKFDRGDVLVLLTDGFIEWENASGDDFGIDRIKAVVRAHRDKGPAAIIAELRAAVIGFAGNTPQLDDLTALIVKKL